MKQSTVSSKYPLFSTIIRSVSFLLHANSTLICFVWHRSRCLRLLRLLRLPRRRQALSLLTRRNFLRSLLTFSDIGDLCPVRVNVLFLVLVSTAADRWRQNCKASRRYRLHSTQCAHRWQSLKVFWWCWINEKFESAIVVSLQLGSLQKRCWMWLILCYTFISVIVNRKLRHCNWGSSLRWPSQFFC